MLITLSKAIFLCSLIWYSLLNCTASELLFPTVVGEEGSGTTDVLPSGRLPIVHLIDKVSVFSGQFLIACSFFELEWHFQSLVKKVTNIDKFCTVIGRNCPFSQTNTIWNLHELFKTLILNRVWRNRWKSWFERPNRSATIGQVLIVLEFHMTKLKKRKKMTRILNQSNIKVMWCVTTSLSKPFGPFLNHFLKRMEFQLAKLYASVGGSTMSWGALGDEEGVFHNCSWKATI